MEPPFLNAPERLWWLLLVPALWWLALPPRPRQQRWTAHMAQWLQAQATLRRRPPRFRRWRFLLLVAGVFGCVLAAARPTLMGRSGPTRLLVVVDQSASMAAVVDGSSAMQRAMTAVRRHLAVVPPHVDVAVVHAGASIGRRQGEAARALADLPEPAGAGVDLAAVAAAAAADDTVVWTVTDGQGARPSTGLTTLCGQAADNVAVAAVDLADAWPLPELQLQVELQSHARVAWHGELLVEGAVLAAGPFAVALAPGERRSSRLALTRQASGGPLRLRLRGGPDALATDDTWAAVLPPLPAPTIAVLATDPPPFVRAAVQALAAEVSGRVVEAGAGQTAGFLVVEGGVVTLAPGSSRAVTFGCRLPGAGEPVVWPRPVVVDWDRQAAITAGLDLSELDIEHALAGSLPPGQPLLWGMGQGGGAQPLAVLSPGAQPSLHFAFRLQDSNLPLLPAFPQLLRRALVASYGERAAVRIPVPVVPSTESDLRALPPPTEPVLPAFGEPGRDLGSWCLLVALLALAVRAYVR